MSKTLSRREIILNSHWFQKIIIEQITLKIMIKYVEILMLIPGTPVYINLSVKRTSELE